MSADAEPLPQRAFVEQVMGMPVSLHVRGAVDSPQTRVGVTQVWGLLRRVDAVFSTWRADSELMRRRRGEVAAYEMHPWTHEVEELCAEASTVTGGLFGAGDPGSATYDPTGLVKGWAIERAARHLAHVPGISFALNAGGDLAVGAGQGSGATPWRVGIEDPRHRDVVATVVQLWRGGLATSGAAARGAHVVDPRTSTRVGRDGSASVWGPSPMWADVWATALFVDPVSGPDLLREWDARYAALLL